MVRFNFETKSVLERLSSSRKLKHSISAEKVLLEIEKSFPSSIPVAVLGSASYEYDEKGRMKDAIQRLGRNLSKFESVVLLTGAMPAVGQDVGDAFCDGNSSISRLYNLLPRRHGISPPVKGNLLFAGENFVQRQFILGQSAAIAIVIGGGPNTVREANVTLRSGGILLPVACTGGAAAGLDYDSEYEIERKIDFEAARSRAIDSGFMSEFHYDELCDPESTPDVSVRMICQAIKNLTEVSK